MILVETSQSVGFGDVRRIIEEQQDVEASFRRSNSLSEGYFSAVQRLERIKKDCADAGWDGEEARGISLTSYENAKIFLSMVPLGIISPDPGIDTEGQVTLEWRRQDGRLLSLTFDDEGTVHYIVFLKSEKFYVKRPVNLGYSEKLKDFLQDILRD
jgi:hypothetical protein